MYGEWIGERELPGLAFGRWSRDGRPTRKRGSRQISAGKILVQKLEGLYFKVYEWQLHDNGLS